MSKQSTGGAFGAPVSQDKSAAQSRIFDYRDRLCILTPVFAYQTHEAFRQCIDICRGAVKGRFRMPDGSVQVLPVIADFITLPNDSHIDRARNVLMHLALDQPWRFPCFIDSDIEPKPEDIIRLWQHLMHGRKFVCGLYAMKTIVPTFVANVKSGATVDRESGLIELNDGGTGCMAFDREVAETMRAKFPERHFKWASNSPFAGAPGFAYFTSGVVERGGAGDWLSEDWKFCHDWKVCGGTIWGDTQIRLHHWGPMRFPPDVTDLVEAADTLVREKAGFFPEPLAAAAREPLAALLTWCRQKRAVDTLKQNTDRSAA